MERDAVQPSRPAEHGRIPATPDVSEDSGGDALGIEVAPAAAGEESLSGRVGQSEDSHHSTILLSGYSTIPCACAALSRGMICRTTSSSTIVFTATHSGLLSAEMVGFFSAGRTSSTAGRFSRRTLSISPTLLYAAMAL